MTVGPATGHRTRLTAPPRPLPLVPILTNDLPRMRTAALIAIHVLAACGRPAAPPTPALPEAARLAPATARFHLVEHRHVEQRYLEQVIMTDAVTRATVSVAIDSAPTGFAVNAMVDSIAVSGDAGVTAESVAAAAGARFRLDIAPDGSVRAVTGPGDGNPLLDHLALRMHELVPRMPGGGAAAGAAWTDTVLTSGRTAGIPISLGVHGRHVGAAAWIELDGRHVLPLATETDYTLSGEGERSGQWITMAGTGTSRVQRFVGSDGVVALGIRDDTLRVTIELQGTGGSIPLTQIRTDTLRRVN